MDPWIRNIPLRREWLPTPVFLPGEFHGQRSLGGYSPWGCKELDTTEPPILTDSPGCLFTLDLLNTDPTRGRVQRARSGRDSVEQYTVQFSRSFFADPQTAACQASLSITNSRSLLKLTSLESVTPSNHLILCHPLSSRLQSLRALESFQMSPFFASGGQSIGV